MNTFIMDSAKYTKTVKFDKKVTTFVTRDILLAEKFQAKKNTVKRKKEIDFKRQKLHMDFIESQGLFDFKVTHDLSDNAVEVLTTFKEQVLGIFNTMSGGAVESFNSIRDYMDTATRSAYDGISNFMSVLQHLFWIVPITAALVSMAMNPKWFNIGSMLFNAFSFAFPDSLSKFKDYVLGLFKQDIVESQAGISLDILTNLVGMGTTALLFGPADYLVWFKRINTTIKDISASFHEGEKLSSMICKLIQGTINVIRGWFGKEKIVLFKTGESLIDAWAGKVAEVTKNYTLCLTDMTPEIVQSLQALRMEGLELDNMYRLDRSLSHSVKYYLQELDKVCKASSAAFAAAKGVRVEPVSVCLYGPPGIGKTILANALSQIVMAEALPIDRIEELDGLLASEIFQKGSSEYWEGYAGQYTFVMDDFAQQVDAVGATDSDFMQLVRIVNSWQYPLNYASLENKGKNNFSSKFVVLTTNVANLRFAASKVVSDPKAVLRRIHNPFQLGVSEDWCAPGKMPFDQNALDTIKYAEYFEKEGKIPLEAWFVVPFDFSNGRIASPVERWSMDKLVDKLVSQLSMKRQQFADTSQHIRSSVLQIMERRTLKAKLDEFHDCESQGKSLDDLLEPKVERPTFLSKLKEECSQFVNNLKDNMWNPIKFVKEKPVIAALVGGTSLVAFGFLAKHLIDLICDLFTTKINDVESEVINYKVLENLNAKVELPAASQIKISKNLFIMNAVNLTTQKFVKLGYATGICGKTFAIPLHFKKSIMNELMNTDFEEQILITFINVHNPELQLELELGQYMSLRTYDFPDMDVQFVQLPVVGCCADITEKFLFKNELNIVKSGVDVMLCGSIGNQVLERMSHAFVHNDFSVDSGQYGYTVKKGFRYSIPTAKGDCGSILMLAPNVTHTQGRKIMGFHTGGSPRMELGFSNAVSQEMVKEALLKFNEVREEVNLGEIEGQADEFVVKGSFMPLYKVKKGISSPPYTKLSKTELYNAWKDNERFPAHLRPFKSDKGEVIKPMVVALSKYNTSVKIFDTDLVSSCAHVAFSKITEHTRNILDRSVLSYEQAVEGLSDREFARGLPRGTSSGYPFSIYGAKGKKDFFGDGETYDFDNENSKFLKQHCKEIELKAKQGVRLLHIYNDFLKDERRTKKKNDKGETRLVSGAPLPYVIVFRQYFLNFISAVMKTRILNGLASGINPYTDWKFLRDHLLENSQCCVAGDYSAFDASEQPQIHEEILNYINKWYDDGVHNARVREVLWRDLMHSRHVGGDGLDNNIIYQWYHALPSGHPATTVVNSMYNLCQFTVCWATIMGRHMLPKYHDNVRIVVLGDDNILTIKNSVVDKFNQLTITEVMSQFGMKYTSENKADEEEPFRTIDNVSFLKRTFYEEDGYVYGPLSMDTILEMPYWCRDKSRKDDIVSSNFETALMELSAHPQAIWEQWATKMIPAYEKLVGRDTILRPIRKDYQEVFKHTVNIY